MSIIRILSTTDLHGAVFPYRYADGRERYIGMARLSTLIRELRDENTVVIDNGDTIEGSPLTFHHYLYEADKECPMIACFREIGYDYINIGNHDFNYGYKELKRYIDDCGAVCLTSNVLYKGKPLGKIYDIKEIAGKRIAFFGVVTHFVPTWEKEENIAGMEFIDAFEAASKTVELIKKKENPDYIICLYHGGLERDPATGVLGEKDIGENQGYRMIEQIEGLTAVICGHQHRNYCGVLNGVAYTEAGIEGEALSCIDINTENDVVIPRLLQVTSEPDEKILAMVRQEEDRTQQWLDTPLGHTPMNMKITSEFADRYHKNQLATFINRVQMELTGADLSGSAIFFKAPGFAGGITMRDLISTYMFPNTLVVKKINGRILREYLEKCLDFWSIQDDRVIINPLYDEPNIQYHNYDMIDGVEYTADIRRPSGSRLVSLTRNGREVRDEDELTLAINNYRASGGGNFDMIANAPTIRDIPDSVVDILAEYIIKHGEIDFEPVDNIRIIP